MNPWPAFFDSLVHSCFCESRPLIHRFQDRGNWIGIGASLLCILTSFWVLGAPKSWLKYFISAVFKLFCSFQTFFVFCQFLPSFFCFSAFEPPLLGLLVKCDCLSYIHLNPQKLQPTLLAPPEYYPVSNCYFIYWWMCALRLKKMCFKVKSVLFKCYLHQIHQTLK